jgi:hypothetical protein
MAQPSKQVDPKTPSARAELSFFISIDFDRSGGKASRTAVLVSRPALWTEIS